MRRLAFSAVLCSFLSMPTLAGIYVKEVGVNPGLTLDISSSGVDGRVWAGVYNLSILGSDAEALGIKGTVQAFCIDVWDYSPADTYVSYGAVSLEQAPDPGAGPMGLERARYLATLLNAHWSDSLTDVQAAALQVAAWEIVDEGNVNPWEEDPVPSVWDVSAYSSARGNFYVTNYQVALLANTWLGEVRNIGGSDYEDHYLALSSQTCGPYYQDYAVRVPVPGASLLGVIGMAMAGIRLRKRATR